MRFEEYEYTRPEEAKVMARLAELQKRFEQAADYEAFKQTFDDLDTYKRWMSTMENLVNIRHSVDTRDAFYDQEQEYLDELGPKVNNVLTDMYKVILASPFVDQLKQDVPETWFLTVDNSINSMSDQIVEDLIAENKAATEYAKLVASAQIEFDGKTYTLASLEEKMNDADEEVRRRAHKAYWGWYADHEEEIGDIYDRLVKIRTNMAKKMGFDTYTPLGYLRMNRLDYNKEDVEGYRENVLEDIVPTAEKLYAMQAERHHRDSLKTWNEKVEFTSGNARPHFPREEMVKRALLMYKELDPKTGEFFQYMVDHNLLDLDAKPGKEAGGYCTYIPDYRSPFIFANFNKTSHDAEVLTHEAGHAFQVYCAQDIKPFDCAWPTMESAEIDSMSMEFFTWPWMELLFEDDADKYRWGHLAGSVKFIPYGVLVDHFQHEVYEHPEWSNEERMAAWRRLEKQYLPHKDYDEIEFLERGGWWMRQLHIFMNPFYYIDYTLAQAIALQFWKRIMDKDPQAFEDYKKICHVGGSLPFKKIVETGNLKVPFEKGCLKDTMQAVENWYEKHPANFD